MNDSRIFILSAFNVAARIINVSPTSISIYWLSVWIVYNSEPWSKQAGMKIYAQIKRQVKKEVAL